MELILDFKTDTTIEEHMSELMQWLEQSRLRLDHALGYKAIQKITAELGYGVNLVSNMKRQRMETQTLTVLGLPCVLNFEFSIRTQEDVVVTSSQYPQWVKMLLFHFVKEQEISGLSIADYAKKMGVSTSGFWIWKKAENIRLTTLFKGLQYFGYRMIFNNNE